MSSTLWASLCVGIAVLLWPSGPLPLLGSRAQPRPDRRTRRTPRTRWTRRTRGRDRQERDTAALIELLDSLAPALAAGLPAERALELVLNDPSQAQTREQHLDAKEELSRRLRDRITAGESVGQALWSIAADSESDGARLLAQAWLLSEETGAPLAATSDCAVRLLRSSRDRERAVGVAVAGARVTIRVLTVLPLTGPLLAVVLGVDPVQAYVLSPPVWACLALAAALVLCGRRWVARQVQAVAQGPLLIPPVRSTA